MALLKEVESLFQDESVVIAAFQVEKLGQVASSDATGTQLLKSLGAQAHPADVPKPRALAFSVKRSLTERGFVASLHLCRREDDDRPDSKLEVRKTYPLKCLHNMRLHRGGGGGGGGQSRGGSRHNLNSHQQQQQQHHSQSSPPQLPPHHRHRPSDGEPGSLPSVELELNQHHSMPEHKGRYQMRDQEQAMLLMSLSVQLLRQQDAVLPGVWGVSLDRLDAWWSSHRELAAASLAPFAAEVVTLGAVQGPDVNRDAGVLVSAKEEADLEQLLDMFALGLGEPEEFAARLQDEQAALEAANVYWLLESGPLVEGVLGQLRRTQGVLDDLDESLKVFDFKLRHMRDDIAAIEASNNALERQSRHNAALLQALDRLLSDFTIDPGVVAQLEGGSLDQAKFKPVIAAAWSLHDKQRRLSPGGGPGSINPLMCGMRSVKEARAKMDALCQRFVARAYQQLVGLVSSLAGDVMTDWGAAGGGAADRASRLKPPDRSRLREALLRYRPLICAVAAMDPGALGRLQLHCAQALNGLLRRELRGCSSELRRAVQADVAAGGGDAGMRERSTYGSIKRPGRPSLGTSSAASDASEDPPGSGTASPHAASSRRGGGGGPPAPGPGATALRLASYLNGSSSGLPLFAAWQQLLGSFLLFLVDEAEFVARVFLMFKGDDPRRHQADQAGGDGPDWRPQGRELTSSGRSAIESLLVALDQDFLVLADMAAKNNQHVMAIPMLATTRAWLSRLRGRPAAAPLSAALGACEQRLAAHWSAHVAAQAAAVDGYDGRSKIGLQGGIKNMHLLPFVGQLASMASELEALLAEAVAEADGALARQQRDERQRQQRRGGGGDGGDGGGGDGGGEGGGGDDEHGEEQQQQEAAHQAALSVRAEVDSAYQALAGRVFSCLERQAAGDAKYADRLRLENYGHYADELGPLAGNAPALRESVQLAEARREGAVAQYIRDQLEWGKLWRLLEFGEKLEKLLQVVSPPEVAFQKDCSAPDVRFLIRSVMEGADKKLDALHGRVRKHLGQTALADAMWARLKEDLLARYERLEELLERCYPNMPLRPSPEELRELFKMAGTG